MQYDKDILNKTGIFVFDNAVSTQLCEHTIDLFNQDKKNHFKGLTGGGYNPLIKNTIDWYINGSLKNKYYSILNIALEKVLEKQWFYKKYNISWTGLQFQKNVKGKGFFKWHCDNDESDLNATRLLAPIFYLNDVEVGGETEFAYQNFKIKPKAGTLIIFPTTFQFVHRGKKPLSNDKFIITTFGITPRNIR